METDSQEHVLSDYRPIVPELIAIGVNDLPRAWPHIEPLLRKACEDARGEFTVDQILHEMGIETGEERWKLLAIVRENTVQAVMVVCLTQTGSRRVLDCLLASGDNAKEWPLVDEQFDAFARGHGCEGVRIPCARKGWLKALPHWKIRGYVLEREV